MQQAEGPPGPLQAAGRSAGTVPDIWSPDFWSSSDGKHKPNEAPLIATQLPTLSIISNFISQVPAETKGPSS